MNHTTRTFISGLLCLLSFSGFAQLSFEDQLVDIGFQNDTTTYCFVSDTNIYVGGWNELQQVKFWRMIMNLPPEYSLLNVAETREIIASMTTASYDSLTLKQRRNFKDSVLLQLALEDDFQLYVTQGRKDYYQIQKILADIHKAIYIFIQEGTDPWFAQAILLIESPGELRVSPVGAKGPFQLMGDIARSEGLVVNDMIDERMYFEPSARGAASFIQRVCLPAARNLLDKHQIEYQEHELWFRLLVLHIYHAGPTTIRRLFSYISPENGGVELIKEMWQTRYRAYGNASQNYSQIALAALLELEEIVYEKGGFFIPSP